MQYTYIMSDIHGHYTIFEKMLEKIEFDETDTLYILGDIMDRGKENIKMLEYVMNTPNIHLLMGNHEDLLLTSHEESVLDRKYEEAIWFYNGGDITAEELKNVSKEKMKEYLNFLKSLDTYKFITINEKEYLLVHAGILYTGEFIDKETLMKKQKDNLLWIREEFIANKYTTELPFTIIFGHTPIECLSQFINISSIKERNKLINDEIVHFDNKIAIDCGCAYDKKLGCLRLEDGEEFYINCEVK